MWALGAAGLDMAMQADATRTHRQRIHIVLFHALFQSLHQVQPIFAMRSGICGCRGISTVACVLKIENKDGGRNLDRSGIRAQVQ